MRPSLPSAGPTTPAWQTPPHPTISNAQSPVIPIEADVVIIGSGITGIGAAHCLLNHPRASNLRVTMVEARTATSGATGRNGGHLVSDSDSMFSSLVKDIGLERTLETVKFSQANIRRLRELVAQLDPQDREAVEFRTLTTATAFKDPDSFANAVQDMRKLLQAIPDGDVKFRVAGKEEASKV